MRTREVAVASMGMVLLGIAGMLPKGDLFLLGVFARLLPLSVVGWLLPLPLVGSARTIYAIMDSTSGINVAFNMPLADSQYALLIFGYAVYQEVVTFLMGYFAKDLFRYFKTLKKVKT